MNLLCSYFIVYSTSYLLIMEVGAQLFQGTLDLNPACVTLSFAQ
jgi:hypothetical protein